MRERESGVVDTIKLKVICISSVSSKQKGRKIQKWKAEKMV